MTVAKFTSRGERLCGFEISGHSGYGQAGEDILCAAISSTVRLIEGTLNDVLGLAVVTQVKEGYVSLNLPKALGNEAETTSQTLLAGMVLYFLQLGEEYPTFLQVFEEDLEEGGN